MTRFTQRLWRQATRRLTGPGMMALVLLGAAAAMALWLPHLKLATETLRSSLATRVEQVKLQDVPAPPRKTRLEQAVEFVDGLPTLARNSDDLKAVFALAAGRNLSLPKGDYQLKQEPNADLVTYVVTLPMRSEYGALKDFVTDVLEHLPHASMEEMRMSRPDASSATLDSTVRFTFAYRVR